MPQLSLSDGTTLHYARRPVVRGAATDARAGKGGRASAAVESEADSSADQRHNRTPVLLLHGAAAERSIWGTQLRDLPRMAPVDVVALDLPGHGRSKGPGRKRIGEYARCVADLVATLFGRPAVIVGHSMGGAIAQTLALDHGEHVAGLVLVGTGARLRVREDLRTGWTYDPSAAVETLIELSYGAEASAAQLERARLRFASADPAVAAGDFAACHDFDCMARVTELTRPVMIVTGARDRLTPPKYARWLAERIPDAELRIVPEAGHMVMIEQSQAVTAAIAALVERVRA